MTEAFDLEFNKHNTENREIDGIEILVQMAKQGKIDPWNINIIDVTNKYLMHLFESKAQNLRLTSRTLLFASILLKLKSNSLVGVELTAFTELNQVNEEYYDDDQLEYEDYVPTNNIISIDDVLQRRTSVRLNRNRIVTLRDLIRQLEFYEMLDKKQALRNAHERARRRVRNYANLSPEEIINLAHDEYIKQGVQRLKVNLEEILNRQDKIELNELVLLGMDRISAYISLLFLTAESEYDLEQDEFYSDLYVIKNEIVSEEEKFVAKEVLADDTDEILSKVGTIEESISGTVEITN